MHLQTVNSSSLEQAGYDAQRRQLIVVFKSGAAYRYDGVPAALYEGLLQAESKGRFFIAYVRDVFPVSRLDGATRALITPRTLLARVHWHSLEFESAFF